MSVPPGPGLYLHLPFCARICPYCDFAVLKGSAGRRRRFVDQLAAEVELVAAAQSGWAPFDTVYLGGGTPSHHPPEELASILAALARLPVDPRARLYLEANPEDVTAESAAAWRRLGFATLSLGVQSFAAAELTFLGRGHDPAAARSAVEHARRAGFETVSIDLIYGLPGQTPADWRARLEAAVALAPDHISCYQLTIHQGTPFGLRQAEGLLDEAPEPVQAELFRLTHRLLADRGYEGYEVSNFARAPEHRSRHNAKYWRHVPYLGLGPSACSYDGGRRRWVNERRLQRYGERLAAGERPVAEAEELSDGELMLEAVMLALRTADGLDLARFEERFGVDLLAARREAVARLVAEGQLGEPTGGRLRPTLDGLAVADSLALALAPPAAPESVAGGRRVSR